MLFSKNSIVNVTRGRNSRIASAAIETLENRRLMSQTQLVLFDDNLTSGFASNQGITTATDVVHTGARSIIFPANKNYDFFKGPNGYGANFDDRPFDALQFWVNGGLTGGQTFTITGWNLTPQGTGSGQATVTLPGTGYLKSATGAALSSIPANQWALVTIPLADLGIANLQQARGVRITSGATAGFYIDDAAFVKDVSTNATVSINTGTNVRTVNDHIFGIATYGEGKTSNASDVAAAKDASWHLQRAFYPTFYKSIGNSIVPNMADGLPFAEATTRGGGDIIGAVNYTDQDENRGTNVKDYGTPEEAAAWVAYANSTTSSTAYISNLALGTDSYGRNWGTVRDWVDLRAGTRSSTVIDGRDYAFMKINHPGGFAVKYWEMDNEPWLRGGDTNWLSYSKWVVAADAKMRQVDPTIKTGLPLVTGRDESNTGTTTYTVTNPVGGTHTGYNDVVLYYLSGQDTSQVTRYVPDFIIDHYYAGGETIRGSDINTLTQPENATENWKQQAIDLRKFLTDYYNTAGRTDGNNPSFIVTEANLNSSQPLSRQQTSIVGGLWLADEYGQMLQTANGDFEGMTIHDWDDGDLAKQNNIEDPYAYGWRNESGYNVYGNHAKEGSRTKYPMHYATKLLSRYFAINGGTVVSATSSNPFLTTYAVKQPNGNLAILLINKSENTDISTTLSLTGFTAGGTATLYRYGKTEERNEADITPSKLAYAAGDKILAPQYSLTVITFTDASAGTGTAPGAPTAPVAVAANGSVKVTWEATSRATAYDLYRATGTGALSLYQPNLSTSDYTDTGVTTGNAYRYTVVAKNSAGTSVQSQEGLSATVAAAPGAVTGLTATANEGEIVLNWTAVSGATDYTVRRSLTSGGPYTVIATHPYNRGPTQNLIFNQYHDRDLANWITYYYQVTATTNGGEGAAATVSATPAATGAWRSVDLTPRSTGSTQYNPATGHFIVDGDGIGWYTNGEGRFVYQKVSGDFTISAKVSAAGNGLFQFNTFGVMMRDSLLTTSGNSVRWAEMALEGIDPTYGANGPIFQTGSTGASNKENRSAASAGIAPYWVRLVRSGNVVTGYLSANGTNWSQYDTDTFTGLPTDVYVGLEANSNEAFATSRGEFDNVTLTGTTSTPGPLQPRNLHAVENAGKVDLTWHYASGAVKYNLYRATTPDGQGSTPYAVITNGTTYTDANVTAGTTYYYKVTAVDANNFESNKYQQIEYLGGEAVVTPVQAQATSAAEWYKADAISGVTNGAALGTWNDSSGNSVNATQSTAANQPTYVTNAINGKPTVRFNAASSQQLAFNRTISDDFTIAVVFKSTQGIGTGTNWYTGAGLVDGEVAGVTNDFGISLNAAGRVLAGVGGPDTFVSSGTGFNDGKSHVAVFKRTRSTGAIALYIDGTLAGTATGGTQSLNVPARLVIGSLQTNSNYFTGDIPEVKVFGSALSRYRPSDRGKCPEDQVRNRHHDRQLRGRKRHARRWSVRVEHDRGIGRPDGKQPRVRWIGDD